MAEEQQQPVGVTLKLEWPVSLADYPTIYANQLYITHASETEFYLVFGELSPLALIEPTQEQVNALAGTAVPIKVVAKIAVSPQTMFKIAEAINTNVERYKQSHVVMIESPDAGDEAKTEGNA